MATTYNYKDKDAPKLTDEFKQKFCIDIKGKQAIKVEGLTVLAHEKGIWKMDTEIVQYPCDANNWTAICRTVVGGYDWDPVTEKVREVEYADIGDANVQNCSKLVGPSFIRMASTRSQGRALRKYTNVDMVCSSELESVVDNTPTITPQALQESVLNALRNTIVTVRSHKNINNQTYTEMLKTQFNIHSNEQLNNADVNLLNQIIVALSSYTPPASPQK